jgi:hypothetical protein
MYLAAVVLFDAIPTGWVSKHKQSKQSQQLQYENEGARFFKCALYVVLAAWREVDDHLFLFLVLICEK